ncbi:SLC13 family permease [Emcibacter sp. SYSU 3D8]|uniref:SLC13 family permease n=1 Tax=Emcibacter sp. SYSU 3D8 TaxID=3133969 RepID=UPI0031FE5BFF
MTLDQGMLFGLSAAILGMLLWGRFRHDLVAAAGLVIAVVLGLVPEERAFSGFASHAVIIVALVLVASRAFENSGALGLLSDKISKGARSLPAHILLTGGIGAALSAVINNVAALALLMPLDMQAARKAGRAPGLTLMPLAFATILGGMVTLIGTPTNIVASEVRTRLLGEPFHMFDFAPVGICVALAGLAFVAVIGWRLVPRRADDMPETASGASFKAELLLADGSPVVGKVGAELDEDAERADVLIIGLLRGGERFVSSLRSKLLEAGDVLVVEGSTEGIAAFMKAADLSAASKSSKETAETAEQADAKSAEAGEEDAAAAARPRDPEVVEAVVRGDSRLVGRSARTVELRKRHDITLLGMARAGSFRSQQVHSRPIQAGDVLLITGSGAVATQTLDDLGLISVSRVGAAPFRPREAMIAIGLFAAAIIAATTGLLSFTIAIAIAVIGYAAIGLVPAREFYQQIEWPVVVLLACLLPVGAAFESLGCTALIADGISSMTQGYPPVVALVTIMVVTMTLSDALNNIATMVITGPVAIDLAQRLQVNPDTFLMGVAIACSCAFLTPIGHKNNTLIMGPGRFRFSDYWRVGLPLELLVIAVSVPMLLIVWPL